MDAGLKIAVWIIAAVLASAGIYQASSVLAPLALALFVIAIVWPLQKRLQSRLPRLLALAVTILVTIAAGVAFASLAAWAFGQVVHALVAQSARYQALYDGMIAWLDAHGISVAGIWSEHFNVAWALRVAQQITSRINTTLTFWLIALLYIVLGLLEIDDMRRKAASLDNREAARVLLDGAAATAVKFRKYLLVRTQMSVVTGLLVWILALVAGLQFAPEWGVIAFVLNYLPFIGPFIATLLPTLLAMTQFETWQAVLAVFLSLNVIQFVIGSYIEPLVSGKILSMAPTTVLFAVFFWTFLWGPFGTFIGVPIAIAILTFCAQHKSSRWLALLLGNGHRQGETPG